MEYKGLTRPFVRQLSCIFKDLFKILEGALLGVLEGFQGHWRPFRGPRAQLSVSPDGNVVFFGGGGREGGKSYFKTL